MRNPIVYQKLDVSYDGPAFPASATLTFVYADGDRDSSRDGDRSGGQVGPAPQIVVQGGRRGTWILRFTPEAPLPQGASVAFRKVENEFRFAYRHQHYWPDALNYVTVEDSEGEPLPFECDTCLKSAVWAVVTLPRDFAPGETIVVRMGDRREEGGRDSGGSCVWPTEYERARVAAGVRLEGGLEGVFRPAPDATVEVKVVPCPPVTHYYIFAPSTARVGEPFMTVIMPVDINGNPLEASEDFSLAMPSEISGHVGPLSDSGMKTLHVETVIDQPGIVRLQGQDPASQVRAASNPIRMTDAEHAADVPNVYWGEFHWHGYDASELNTLNPNTHPEKAYRYGRDVSRLDFCASGSHIFRHTPEAVHEWWDLYREAAQTYDEPGRYVTFMGCEWRDATELGGDRNIIWKNLDVPAPDPTWKIDELYGHFRGQPVMMTPHVGGAIALPYHHDPEVERLCEMVSGHGNFEWFGQAYLSKGYRVGLIGGSDGHRGTPGHPRVVHISGGRFANMLRLRDAGWSGGPLLAVYAERLDRDALWEAFRARRTYASTGARALVEFRVNGAMMGSEIAADKATEITWRVAGTAPIVRVDLIRDRQRLARWQGTNRSAIPNRSAMSRYPSTEAGLYMDRPPDGVHYYYLRVLQTDGELLWSSPVWVESTCGGPQEDLPAWNAPEPINLEHIDDTPASNYLDDVLDYLRTEENLEAFEHITPYTVIHAPMGSYAVFLCTVRGKRLRIHWFYEFEVPRIRLEVGWCQYGRERIMGEPWAAPLFSEQDRLGS